MTRHEAITTLVERDLLYVTTSPGSEVYYAAMSVLPPELWPLSGWAILGQLDGLEWLVCDVCDEVKLTKPRKVKCGMTSGCTGAMQRIAPRPRTTKKLKELIYQ